MPFKLEWRSPFFARPTPERAPPQLSAILIRMAFASPATVGRMDGCVCFVMSNNVAWYLDRARDTALGDLAKLKEKGTIAADLSDVQYMQGLDQTDTWSCGAVDTCFYMFALFLGCSTIRIQDSGCLRCISQRVK